MRNFIYAAVSLFVVCVGTCNFIIPTFGDYSDGVRSGILQKFSKKGIMFKTYEGELAMEGIKITSSSESGSSASSVFAFSVTDPTIAAQLDSMIDKRVTLTYRQVFHANLKDGETEYFITGVKTAVPTNSN